MTFLSSRRLRIVRYSSLVRLNCSAFPGKTDKRLGSVLFKNNSNVCWITFGRKGEVGGGWGVPGIFTMECRDFLTTLGFNSKIPFASHLSTEFVKVPS